MNFQNETKNKNLSL